MAKVPQDSIARSRIVCYISSVTAFVYLLRCSDNTLYAGYTFDLQRRLQQHARGTGSKYVRSRLPFTLAASFEVPARDARRVEAAVKKLTRPEKERLIARARRYDELAKPHDPPIDIRPLIGYSSPHAG